MAIQQIEFEDKEAINIDSTVPDKNKCNASDLNEIKNVVNSNSYETPKVSSQVDTDYKVNVLTTKNLFDINTIPTWLGADTNYSINNNVLNVSGRWYIGVLVNVKSNTNYYFSATKNIVTSTTGAGNMAIYDNNKQYIKQLNDGGTFNSGNNNQIYIVFYSGGGSAGEVNFSNIQLEEGTTSTTYEPFIQNTINVNNEKYTDTINVGTTINDKNRVNVLYSKNILPYPYVDTTKTTNGITFTDNGDGTITIRGTATANAPFKLLGDADNQQNIMGNYINGGISTNIRIQVVHYNPGYTVLANSSGSESAINKTTYSNGYIEIVVANGTAITTPITIKPIITNKSYSGEWTKYIGSPTINVDGEEIYSRPVLLWTNPSPRTQFAGQTITLNDNMSNYKFIDFIYYDDVDANTIHTNRIYDYQTKARLTAFIFYSNNLYFRQRVIQKSNDTQIAINDNQQFYINNPTTTTQNNGCIPHQIIGYK